MIDQYAYVSLYKWCELPELYLGRVQGLGMVFILPLSTYTETEKDTLRRELSAMQSSVPFFLAMEDAEKAKQMMNHWEAPEEIAQEITVDLMLTYARESRGLTNVLYALAHYPEKLEQHQEQQKQQPSFAQSRRARQDVYVARTQDFYKIGVSQDPKTRVQSLDGSNPYPVELLFVIPTDTPRQLEETLHAQFADKRESGEWFALQPDDVAYLKGLAHNEQAD